MSSVYQTHATANYYTLVLVSPSFIVRWLLSILVRMVCLLWTQVLFLLAYSCTGLVMQIMTKMRNILDVVYYLYEMRSNVQ